MNNSRKYEEIEYYYFGVKYNENGNILWHPLETLYHKYQDKNKNIKSVNYNDVIFAGNELYLSQKLNDVSRFDVKFFGEPDSIFDREIWANPLRAEILKSLSGENKSWYLSFVGRFTDWYLDKEEREIQQEVLNYFSNMDKSRMVDVKAKKPFGLGGGDKKRLFFEVKNEEIFDFVRMIWNDAWESYSIQGYNFESGEIYRIREWGKRVKDEMLFREILDSTQVFFYTYPEENRHFSFFSNKYSENEFKEKIHLNELRKEADILLRDLGYKE